MSNLGSMRAGNRPGLPTPPRGTTIARYGTYAEAQHAVDYLSDQHFAVQSVTIVGTDLRMVERVTGRLTYGRVALAGVLSGAWFGLFVGLLLSLFGGGPGVGVFAAVIIGAGFGMLFGVISYAFTGGRRDFTSTSQIVASEYLVLCLEEQAGQAMQLLRQIPAGRGPGGPDAGLGAPATVSPAPADAAAPAGPPVSEPVPTGTPSTVPVPSGGATVAPAYGDAPPAPAAEPDVTGPTYGEMIEKQRREQREREFAERSAAAQQRAHDEHVEAQQRAHQEHLEAERRSQRERERETYDEPEASPQRPDGPAAQ